MLHIIPKISIVIPVYNVQQYLKRCIDSILNQTFEDYEIILVNDGSTDNSGQICDEYRMSDSRIKVISQQNSGAPTARNVALDAALGEYIYFVDSDDYIHPQTLELLYDAANKHDTDVSVCGYEIVYDDYKFEEITDYECEIISNFDLLAKMVNLPEMTFSHVLWNKLFKKQAIGNIRMNTDYVIDDFDFVSRVLFNCNTVALVDKKLYCYYHNNAGVMSNSTYNPKKFLELQAWYDMAHTYKRLGNETMYHKCIEMSLTKLLIFITNYCIGKVNDHKWIDYLKEQISLKKDEYMQHSNYIRKAEIICFEKNHKLLKICYRLFMPLKDLIKRKRKKHTI